VPSNGTVEELNCLAQPAHPLRLWHRSLEQLKHDRNFAPSQRSTPQAGRWQALPIKCYVPVQPAELTGAVREAITIDARQRARRCEQAKISTCLARLSPRERQVLHLLMTGMLNKQVAAEFGVSEQTIKTHRRQVLHKMEVRTTTALVGLLYGVKSQRNEPPYCEAADDPSGVADDGRPGRRHFALVTHVWHHHPLVSCVNRGRRLRLEAARTVAKMLHDVAVLPSCARNALSSETKVAAARVATLCEVRGRNRSARCF
jgi:DNA-binding CsgD family transcriptional regulator